MHSRPPTPVSNVLLWISTTSRTWLVLVQRAWRRGLENSWWTDILIWPPRRMASALCYRAGSESVGAAARAAGLAGLGRRVDLVERSIRRGEGDPELAEALRRDAEGEWE